MSNDPNPQAAPVNTVGALADLGARLVTALPPAFLMLCLVNAIFIGAVLWFLDDQLDQRTKLVGTLVDRCLDIALHAQPPH
jgi:hypothetical protein